MAKLLRNATTNEYYTETARDGGFVSLLIHPEGSEYLQQQGVEENDRIPAELMLMLEENEWLSVAEVANELRGHVDASEINESETNAPPADERELDTDPLADPLPSVKMEPRPWMEQENVEAFREDTDTTNAVSDQPETKSGWTQADRSNANPITHGEDAAFVGNVWFWLLIVVVMVIAVWGLVEVF